MRFATVLHEGRERAAVVAGRDSEPLTVHLFDDATTVLDLVRGGLAAALEAGSAVAAGAGIPLDSVTLLAPLKPPTMRDFVAFEEHVEGIRSRMGGPAPAWFEAPTFYFTNPYAVIGTGADVSVPPGSQQFDYELELGIVIGQAGHDLSPTDAADTIFGYTILNDWSARDLQRREMAVNLGPAKGKDSASTLGPWIVTADEFVDRHNADGFLRLLMTVSVNGVETGRDLLSNMGWPIPELIAYASVGTWVQPGDVLGSGTCGNGGCLAELWGRSGEQTPPPLRPGDIVEMTIDGIGSIRNTVVAGLPKVEIARARTRPRDRTP